MRWHGSGRSVAVSARAAPWPQRQARRQRAPVAAVPWPAVRVHRDGGATRRALHGRCGGMDACVGGRVGWGGGPEWSGVEGGGRDRACVHNLHKRDGCAVCEGGLWLAARHAPDCLPAITARVCVNNNSSRVCDVVPGGWGLCHANPTHKVCGGIMFCITCMSVRVLWRGLPQHELAPFLRAPLYLSRRACFWCCRCCRSHRSCCCYCVGVVQRGSCGARWMWCRDAYARACVPWLLCLACEP
jgi:hypothetical protein